MRTLTRFISISIACLLLALMQFGCGSHELSTNSDNDGDNHRDTDSLFEISIETRLDVDQGQHCLVDVTMDQAETKFGGFYFRLAYDASALSLANVTEGEIYNCGWEYFNFRFGEGCSDSPVSGLVSVIGLAELDYTPGQPDFECADAIPRPFTLFTLDFLVSDDRTLEGGWTPIQFYWCDCYDNVIGYGSAGDSYVAITGVSRYVLAHDATGFWDYIEDSETGFPSYYGVQAECLGADGPADPTRYVDFTNGGIDIIMADSIDARPECLDGDFDMDGTGNTFDDLIIFRDFLVGLGGVMHDFIRCAHTTSTDLNEDGIPLTVADLQYMSRIFAGDAIPTDSLPADSSRITVAADGTISVDHPMAAGYIRVRENVTPVLLADSMRMVYHYDGSVTRILVHSLFSDNTFEGDFIQVPGTIVSMELATPEGVRRDWVLFGNSRSNAALLRK